MTSLRTIARLTTAIILLGACAWAQSETDPAPEPTTRKPAAHARRVITNDDIPPSPQADPAPAKTGGKTPAEAKSDAGSSLAKAGLSKSDPEVKEAIDQLKKQETILQEKLNRIKERLSGEDDEFRRQMWTDALENQKATLEQFRKVRERLEREQQSDQNKAKDNTKDHPTSGL